MKNTIIIASIFALCACSGKRDLTPTNETQALLKNLLAWSDVPMYGHQDDNLYGVGWSGDWERSDVLSVVGDYPAVMGYEIGGIEQEKPESLDGVRFDYMRNCIVDAFEKGCIITISWHGANPLTGGNAWDVSSKDAVKSILSGGEKHKAFRKQLHNVADFVSSLQTSEGVKIPVLFRPYHEHTGSWFWWGQELCTTDEYKQLWHETRAYFDEKGINNVIWVYSSGEVPDAATYLERYPGDEYVDVLGFDCYQFGVENSEQYIAVARGMLAMVSREAHYRNKPYAFTETGLEGIPDKFWWSNVLLKTLEGYNPIYVLTWRNAYDREGHFYAPYPGQVSADDFNHVLETGGLMFRNDLPDMYN